MLVAGDTSMTGPGSGHGSKGNASGEKSGSSAGGSTGSEMSATFVAVVSRTRETRNTLQMFVQVSITVVQESQFSKWSLSLPASV
jgi:hypothetical protein